MKLQVKAGTTSKLVKIFVPNSTASTGVGLTGLAYNTASLTAYYIKEGDASATEITLADMTVGTWASGGFKEIDSTNMPGWYEVGLPNAAIASSASVGIHFQGAANMAPVPVEIELVAYNPQDAANMGLTSMAAIGTPVALDGAAATLGAMLTKMADDNGGADFDATTDSLEKIVGTIVTGAPVNNAASGQTVNNGTVDAGGYANTENNDGSYFQLSPNGSALDVELLYNIGTDRPSEILVNGYWNGAANYCNVFAWNYSTAAMDQLSNATTRMNSASSDNNYTYIVTENHFDTNGDMRIGFVSSSTNAAHDLYLDQVIVKSVSVGYSLSEIGDAVASHDISTHMDHNSFGFRASLSLIDEYAITTNDTASSFTCSTLPAVADYYNDHLIRIHDIVNDRYVDSWIQDMDGAGVITLGKALPFTPAIGDEMYVMKGTLSDIAQSILVDTADMQPKIDIIGVTIQAISLKTAPLSYDAFGYVNADAQAIDDSETVSTRLRQAMLGTIHGKVNATPGTSTTIVVKELTNDSEANLNVSDLIINRTLTFISGACKGQMIGITSQTAAASDPITLTTTEMVNYTNISENDEFVIT